jgi:hypothetical protein
MLLHTFEVAVRWGDNVSSSNYFDRFIKSHKRSQYCVHFQGTKSLMEENTCVRKIPSMIL